MQRTVNRILLTIIVILIGLLGYKTFKTSNMAEASAVTTVEGKTFVKLDAPHETNLSDLKAQVEPIIKEYLMNNPDLIIASLEDLQKRRMNDMESKTNDYIANNKSDIEDAASSPIMGNNEGDVTIVAFYDYTCGHCKRGNSYLNSLIASDKSVKVILKPFPVLGPISSYAAKVALAVHKLEPLKFNSIHEALMEMKGTTTETINALLIANGLDEQKIVGEADKTEIQTILNTTSDLAGKLKIQGVPAYIINGKLVRGLLDPDQLQELIDQTRAKSK